MEGSNSISIFIADSNDIRRIGLRHVLNQIDGFKVTGESGDGRSTLSRVIELKPDVVLMRTDMPLVNGLEVTKQIKQEVPDVHVMMLGNRANEREIYACLGAGARGHLTDVSISLLVGAICGVAHGAACFDQPSIVSLRKLLHTSAVLSAELSPMSALSQREREVLGLLTKGRTNMEIAKELILSVDTIKTHVRRIVEKMAVRNRTEAVVKATRLTVA